MNNGLYADGAARWRSTTNFAWRRGAWSAALAAYYVGKTHDAGATTTAAVYASLGRPSFIVPFFTAGQTIYRRVIDLSLSFNATFGYRFNDRAPALLRRTQVRLGLINLNNEEPPVASGGFGYDASVSQNLLAGRTWTIEFTRTF